ncbi:MAG: 3-oxoacyl-[acyl-carrier protein] reductase [Synergistaceae bacterium]|nr:3-oxoacyl-[acyl-carrier protein] reductase [Synergistaceae bacterium]HOA77472.1 SDR family oxidoreductase [Thermosynergistes sp.]HPZ76419.1 SDR family oxidoreductase [Thermosynergistes sp.]
MDLGLEGKSVLVLASSSGLGKAIAAEFAKEGSRVMISSSNEEKLRIAQREIKEATGNEPLYRVCDITKADQIKALVRETASTFGTIHVLVNNAGGPPPGTFESFGDDAWQRAFELDLLSYVRSIREVLPYMKKGRWGRIVNSTSSSVKEVIDNLILSNTFRIGVAGMSKTLAREVAPYGILVNVIGPGRILTPRLEQVDRANAQEMRKSVEEIRAGTLSAIPLGRFGDPAEYAKLAVFLCSEANTYITGQTIIVDGGMVKAVP